MLKLKRKRVYLIIVLALVFIRGVGVYLSDREVKPTVAVSKSKVLHEDVNVSDAVYADLAIKHYLNNVSVSSIDPANPQNNISLNVDRQWLPASTVKTFVAIYAYSQIDKGNIHLDDQVLVEGKNVVPTELVTTELPALQEGESVNIYRLIQQMITQSDNTAYNVLLDVLDRRNITDYIRSVGLENTAIGSKLNLDTNQEQYEFNVSGFGVNTTTAEDYSKAFQLLNDNKIPLSTNLLFILSQQKINNMIPLLLPKSIKVAHKTGDLDPLYHDGGIVTTSDRKYILSIFTNVGDPKLLAHISEIIYTKNINLVGINDNIPTVSQLPLDQSIDTLVENPTSETNVLGVSSIPVPAITAADLGVEVSDLSSNSSKSLSKVLIPADSRFHFIVTAAQFARKFIAITPSTQIKANLDEINLKIAEANDLKNRGKVTQANILLTLSQKKMVSLTKNKNISSDLSTQRAVQAISDNKFSVLGSELKNANSEEKLKIIKEISNQAKETVTDILPKTPQATNAISPEQKPIVGEVVKSSGSGVEVRTASGQIINISNEKLKIKDGENSITTFSSASTLKKGTAVALVGVTNQNNTFVPSFVLKNVPKEIIAPQPATILKVNVKKKTMVVSENGVPIQVNLTNQAVIRGKDTNVSISSIKSGDVVVVRPDIKVATNSATISSPTPSGSSSSISTSKSQPNFTQSAVPVPSSSPTTTQTLNQTPKPTVPSAVVQNTSPALKSTTSQPKVVQTLSPISSINPSISKATSAPIGASQNSAPAKPVAPQIKVIQSSSVQVIEKKQDVGKPLPVVAPAAPAAPVSAPKKEEKKQESAPVTPPAPAVVAPVIATPAPTKK